MELKQLEYFLVIAEEQQLTAAAKRLFMSQPPLSYQLKNLEEELGTELFERGGRKMKLTPAGEILKQRATQILELSKNTLREMEDYGNGFGGLLSIGAVSSLVHTLFPEPLVRFQNEYPNVRLSFLEGNAADMVSALIDGKVEIAIIRVPINSTKLEHLACDLYNFEQLFGMEENMVAIVHKDDDPFPGVDEIAVEQLKDHPLIISSRFYGLITSTFYAHGLEANIRCVCDGSRNSVLWAENRLGITMANSAVMHWEHHPSLALKVIREPLLQTRQVTLWRKDKYISSLARNFLHMLDPQKGLRSP